MLTMIVLHTLLLPMALRFGQIRRRIDTRRKRRKGSGDRYRKPMLQCPQLFQ